MPVSSLTRRVIDNLTDAELKIAVREALQGESFQTGSNKMLSQIMEMSRPSQGLLVPEAEVASEVIKAAAEKWLIQP